MTMAGDCRISDAVEGIVCRLVVTYTLMKVENKLCFRHVSTEGIAVETGTPGGCQLYPHIGPLEFQGVIAGAHALIAVMEDYLFLTGINDGKESHIAKIAYAGAAKMLMTETYQHRIGVVVAGTPVPTAGVLCGTELDITEGHVGTKKYMSVSAGADSWIHVLCEIVLCETAKKCTYRKQ